MPEPTAPPVLPAATNAELLDAIDLVEQMLESLADLHPSYATQRVGLKWMRQHIAQREQQLAIAEAFAKRWNISLPGFSVAGRIDLGRAVIAAIQDAGHTVTLNETGDDRA